MKALRIIIGWGLLCLAAAGLQGQTASVFQGQVQDIVRKTRLQIGPIRMYPVFNFKQFSWVSNIFGFTNTLNSLSDLVITPSLELRANIIFKNSLVLTFVENPAYYFYLTNSGYRGFANSYRAEAHVLVFNRFIVSGQYDHSTQRYLGLQELDRVVENAVESYSAGVFTQSARGTSLTLEGRINRLNYQDVLTAGEQISSVLDREEKMGSVEIGYRVFSATRFTLRGAYTQYDFLPQESSWRTSHAFELLAGLQFPGTSVIRGSLALGFKKFIPTGSGVKGFTAFIASAGLQFRFENFGILDLRFSRNNNFSLSRDFLYFIDSSVEGRLTFRFLGPLYLRLGGHYGLLNYPEGAAGALNPDGGKEGFRDSYSNASGGFIIRLSPTFGIGLTFQTWLRASRLFGGNYRGNLITVDIQQGF